MSIIVERKSNETPVSLTDRFSKEVRRSGILQKAKELRYRQRPESTLARKKSALSKLAARQRYHQLKKMGKI